MQKILCLQSDIFFFKIKDMLQRDGVSANSKKYNKNPFKIHGSMKLELYHKVKRFRSCSLAPLDTANGFCKNSWCNFFFRVALTSLRCDVLKSNDLCVNFSNLIINLHFRIRNYLSALCATQRAAPCCSSCLCDESRYITKLALLRVKDFQEVHIELNTL